MTPQPKNKPHSTLSCVRITRKLFFSVCPLSPGPYDITEQVPAGFQASASVTSDPTGGSFAFLNVASVDLAPGETVQLLFTNTELAQPAFIPFFVWHPIYPDGIGDGLLRYVGGATGTFRLLTPDDEELIRDSSLNVYGGQR